MDPALSIQNPSSINFDLNLDVSNCDDEEEDADALEREKALETELNVLDDGDLVGDDDDDDIIVEDDIDEDQMSSASELSQHPLQSHEYQYYKSKTNGTEKHSAFHEEQSSMVNETSKQSNGYSNEFYRQSLGYKFLQRSETGDFNSEVNNCSGETERNNPTDFNLLQKSDNREISPEYNNSDNDAVLHELKEQFRQLQILHMTQGHELQQVKKNEMEVKQAVLLLQANKENLLSNLQQSQDIVSNQKHCINELELKVSTLEMQLSTETKAKENAQEMLKHIEMRAQSLQNELDGVNQSQGLTQLQNQYSRLNDDMKLRHQKECLVLKEEIDKLQQKLDAKAKEVNELEIKITDLEQSSVQKSELINKFSENLLGSQQRCEQLLQSGTTGEVTMLKLKLGNLEEEKKTLEHNNLSLKEKIRFIQSELRCKDNELKKQESELKSSGLDNKGKGPDRSGNNSSASNLSKELERALKTLQSERSTNSSLKKDLENTSKEVLFYQEMSKSLKSKLSDKEKQINELEMKLKELHASESTPIILHERSLQNEISELAKNLETATHELKEVKQSKEALSKLNAQLRNEMATMSKKHEEELKEAQTKDYTTYENAVKKIKMQFFSEAKAEMERKCRNYDAEIDKLQRETQLLNDQLFSAKSQYVSCSDENQSLQSKVDELKHHVSKNKEEIEKEIRIEYDKKYKELNEYYQKQSIEYINNELGKEINKAQEEWTKQKMEHIKEFIEKAKQDFSEEFAVSLEKEKNEIEREFLVEKENICFAYESKIKVLKQSFEQEKEKLELLLNQNSESRSKEQIQKTNLQHEQDVKNLMETFQRKTSAWEVESQNLKKIITDRNSKHSQEKQKLQHDLEQEKIKYFNEEKKVKEKLNEVNEAKQKISNDLKRYQKYVSTIKKQYKELANKMENKISEWEKFKTEKEVELNQIKQNHVIELLEIEEKYKRAKIIQQTESYCQTTEQMISTTELVKIQQVFLSCLKQIEGKIKDRLLEHRKQSGERLKKALKNYHKQLVAKVFQDVTNNEPLSSPTICISQSSLMSDTNVQNKYTGQFTTNRNATPKYTNSTVPSSLTAGFLGAGDEPTKQNSNLNKFCGMISTPSLGEPKKVDFMPSPSYFNDISFDFMPVPETASAPSLFTNKLSFI